MAVQLTVFGISPRRLCILQMIFKRTNFSFVCKKLLKWCCHDLSDCFFDRIAYAVINGVITETFYPYCDSTQKMEAKRNTTFGYEWRVFYVHTCYALEIYVLSLHNLDN